MIQNQIGTLTELVAEGTNYITEKDEVFDKRTFVKRRILLAGETINDFREATEREYAEYQQNTPPRKT